MSTRLSQAAALEQKGDRLSVEGKWEKAVIALNEARDGLQHYDEKVKQSRIEAKIGQCHVELGQYSQALSHFEQQLLRASECYDEKERQETEALARYNVGIAHFFLGNFANATKELMMAQENIERPMMMKQIARAESLLGIIAYLQNDYEKALKHHKRDLKASKKSQDTLEMFRARINIQVCNIATQGHLVDPSFFQDCAFDDGEIAAPSSSGSTALARSLYLEAFRNNDSFDTLDRAVRLFEPPTPPSRLRTSPPLLKAGDENRALDRRAEDSIVASLIHSERARREYERREPSRSPDIDLAERHAEAALAYAQAAQALLSAKQNEKTCTGVALALLSAHNALGWMYAIRGDFKSAGAAFAHALATLDDDANKGDAGHSFVGTADILLFPDGADRRESLRRAMKRNIGIAARAGVGLGRFFAATHTASPKVLRNAVDVLTSAEDEATGHPKDEATIHNHRGCALHFLGSRKGAMADFEKQLQLAKQSEDTTLEMDALRNLVDVHEARGDLQIALKYSRMRVRLAEKHNDSIAIADESKRIASVYCSIGANYDSDDDEDGEKDVGSLSIAKLDSMHPSELERRERDVRWIRRNYKILARWSLQRYKKHAYDYLLP